MSAAMGGRWSVALALVVCASGCPYFEAPVPPGAEPAAAPPGGAASWWVRGDAACPRYEIEVPSGPPGAGLRRARVRETRVGSARTRACYAEGVKHGLATEWQPDGSESTGTYEHGVRTGRWVSRDAEGRVTAVGMYVGGVPDGHWTYYQGGQPVVTGNIRDGARSGRWTQFSFDSDGYLRPERFELFEGGRRTAVGGFRGEEAIRTTPVCLVGGAYPYCNTILVGDIGPRVALGQEEADEGGILEGGLYINTGYHQALGATVGWMWNDPIGSTVARLRYRYWLAYPLSVDIAPSLYFDEDDVSVGVLFGAALTDMIGSTFEIQRDSVTGEVTSVLSLRISLVAIATAIGLTMRVAAEIH